MLSSDRILQIIRDRKLGYGQPLTLREQTVSTSDDALQALKAGAAAGALFVAEQQTGGRGRHGRQWHSVAGQSLTFSLVLRPCVALDKLSAVTLVVGLAVHDALTQHGATDLKLKWPNDLVHHRKKLVGILVEKPGSVSSRDTGLVVGIGMNVGKQSVPDDLTAQATSLEHLVTTVPARETLLVDVLQHIEHRITQFETQGFSTLLGAIRNCDALIDERIKVEHRVGIARGIGNEGELLLDVGGQLTAITSGTVLYAPA